MVDKELRVNVTGSERFSWECAKLREIRVAAAETEGERRKRVNIDRPEEMGRILNNVYANETAEFVNGVQNLFISTVVL